jgi:hypothetical protein
VDAERARIKAAPATIVSLRRCTPHDFATKNLISQSPKKESRKIVQIAAKV